MNDDRKFQERAEMMKQLFLARIPTDAIAKIAGISESTVSNDRERVANYYGINVPNAAVTTLEREERFRLLLKAYLEVILDTYDRENLLYRSAKYVINFERVDNHIFTLESFLVNLQRPRFTSDDQIAKNYQKLLEDCIPTERYYLRKEFYQTIHSGKISYESIRNESDLIDLATKFFCEKDRSIINTLTIKDPKQLIDSLFSEFTQVQINVLREYYGLDGEKKTLAEIAEEEGVTRERIRQIREKSVQHLREILNDRKYLIHSTAKYEHLEKQYAEINEQYKNYYTKTDNEIFLLKVENARLNGIFENNNVKIEEGNFPAYIKVLTKPIERTSDLPCRIKNSLYYQYDFILDAIEDWDNLIRCKNFGKKSYMAFEDYLLDHGVDRQKLTLEERVFARQLISRTKENDT